MSDLEVFNLVKSYFEPLGFEIYPFKIEQYNERVDTRFKLNYSNDNLALFVLNTPIMFDTTFMRFLDKCEDFDLLNDPIDECMNLHFNQMKNTLNSNGFDTEMIQDYELTPTRRAKILLQTCAHISGAAYFYKTNKNDIRSQMGVCLHPKFGGWFAMRGVFIFKNVKVENISLREPIDVLNGDEKLIEELTRRFNTNWKDGTYRDMIQVEQKYSQKQLEYFLTDPAKRKELIKLWLKSKRNSQSFI
jgi:cyanocobalamin reductase (cyanide-eliminating) / alkylcobalamin dealkylase